MEEGLLEPLVPAGSSASTSSLQPMTSSPGESSAGAGSQGLDIPGLKKRSSSLHSWTSVDCRGNCQVIELDKLTMMRRCNLPFRDLRLLDPIFVYPSTILVRKKAIVVILEQIRCIITAEEVLLLTSSDSHVLEYVTDLQSRLTAHSGDVLAGRGTSRNNLLFEFLALEVALEAACTFLVAEAVVLEKEGHPLLDEFTSKISTLILERVRCVKSKIVALTRRVQKVRDEIEHLMDDDRDTAMYLTERKSFGDQSLLGNSSASADVVGSQKLGETLSTSKSRHESLKRSDSTTEHIEGLEMLLEAYFTAIDSTLNRLTSLNGSIDHTEDSINIQLDNVQNRLNHCELILTTATLLATICGVVFGAFGVNSDDICLDKKPTEFKWLVTITLAVAVIIFFLLLCLYKRRKLMPPCRLCTV